jgi:hypothetical protein
MNRAIAILNFKKIISRMRNIKPMIATHANNLLTKKTPPKNIVTSLIIT